MGDGDAANALLKLAEAQKRNSMNKQNASDGETPPADMW